MARTRVVGRPLRTRWKNRKNQPCHTSEQGGALAFIAWRMSHEAAINLHGEDYVYRDDGQRLDVISELLAFILHLADRLSFGKMPDTIRHQLINALSVRLTDHIEDNRLDWQGPGNYRDAFVQLLNQRSDEYAEEGFDLQGPKYGMYRHLGGCVQRYMDCQDAHDNRWVIDQMMEVEGPEIYKKISQAMSNLLDTGSIDLTPPTQLEDHIKPLPDGGIIGE